jgi:hypothetical protein
MGLIIASKRPIQSSVWVMDHMCSPKMADLKILTRCNGGVYDTESLISGRKGLVSIFGEYHTVCTYKTNVVYFGNEWAHCT